MRPGESKNELLVAIDVGTTGARAVAVDLRGRVVNEVRCQYSTRVPRPGWAEQDPQAWGDNALEALERLSHSTPQPERILAIGLTGQCPSVAPVASTGRPLGPGLIYRDNRAVEEAAEMRQRLGEVPMHGRTGHVANAFHVGPKVLWMRKNSPATFRSAAYFMQPRDLVLYRLTGRFATDQSHANATLFFDLKARAWAPDLFDLFGLDPATFPEALEPWSVAGPLRSRLARRFGLREGTPVVAGAADSQCAAFGARVWDPGPVSEMAGSSSCLNASVLKPVNDVRITQYSHAVPNRFSTELGVNTSGAALEWAISRLGFSSYQELAHEAAAFRRAWRRRRPADPRQACPLFLPYLGDGERDDPDMRGSFIGLSDRHDRRALGYAVVEGIALAVRRTLVIVQQAGLPVEELRIAGGGARLDVVGQVKADVLGCRVLHIDVDTASVGAALLAAEAIGLKSEVRSSLDRLLAGARKFEPADWAGDMQERAAWFDSVVASPAVHL